MEHYYIKLIDNKSDISEFFDKYYSAVALFGKENIIEFQIYEASAVYENTNTPVSHNFKIEIYRSLNNINRRFVLIFGFNTSEKRKRLNRLLNCKLLNKGEWPK